MDRGSPRLGLDLVEFGDMTDSGGDGAGVAKGNCMVCLGPASPPTFGHMVFRTQPKVFMPLMTVLTIS